MKLKNLILLVSISVGSVGLTTFAGTRADNSKTNASMQAKGELTSQDQGSSEPDVELTRKIRQALVSQDSLSIDAKNVKVITINGVVTLKGIVKTPYEKNEVEKIATSSAGKAKIINELLVE